MKRSGVGLLVLGASAAGYPLTEVLLRRSGSRGAWVVKGVCLGLGARDLTLVISGVPKRLRPAPALLLYLELGSAALASVLTLRLCQTGRAVEAESWEPVRRLATFALFGLHTARFYIYLGSDRGRHADAGFAAARRVTVPPRLGTLPRPRTLETTRRRGDQE
jgi:hypothetical protein